MVREKSLHTSMHRENTGALHYRLKQSIFTIGEHLSLLIMKIISVSALKLLRFGADID